MMGGALGLAVLASLAAAQTTRPTAAGATTQAALNGGYQVAFVVGAIFAAAAALIGTAFMRAGAHGRARDDRAGSGNR